MFCEVIYIFLRSSNLELKFIIVVNCVGYYQADTHQATCDLCPQGKYCDPHELANVTGIIYPVDCPAGFYCPTGTEYSTQNPCRPGTYSNQTQLTSQGQYSLVII